MLANIIRNTKKTAIGGGGGGIVTGGDPYYSAVSLLLSMDGTNGSTTFTDSSLNGLTVTAAGNAQISTTQSKYGGASGYFDGAGDYINATAGNQFQFGTGDFTVEMWVWASSNPGQYKCLFSNRGVDASSIFLGINPSAKLLYYRGAFLITDSVALSLNQWYHVALVRKGSTITLYKNGVSAGSVTDATNLTGNTCFVAQESSLASTYFNGYIDDLRISQFARYVSNFTPPTAALPTTASSTPADPYYGYTSLLLHMDGSSGSTTFTDSGPSALTVTASGDAQISTAQSKYGGASAYFDGSGDYLSATCPDITGSWTVECWWYPTTVLVQQTIVSFNSGASPGVNIWCNTSGRLVIDNGVTGGTPFTGGSFTANQWNHIAVVRNGTTTTGYINGSAVGSNSFTPTASSVINVGRYAATPFPYLSGYIDDLRITRYARYTSAFTPPTQALPNIYNPYTTLPVSGAALWLDASQQNTIFSDAGTTPVTTSGQSIYQWNDLSGNNRHAIQATSGNRPTWLPPASGQNGLGAISFKGSSQWLDIASFPSLASGYTFYGVLKQPAASGIPFCTANAGAAGSNAHLYSDTGTSAFSLSQWGLRVAGPATSSTPLGFLANYDGAHPTGVFMIRTSQGTSNVTGSLAQNVGTPAAGTARLGRATNTWTFYFNSQLYELVVLPRQSTTAEDTSWKSYSASKWGITWS